VPLCKWTVSHIVPVGPIEVVRTVQRDVRVRDGPRVMQVVWTTDVRQQPVQDNHVALLGRRCVEPLAVFDTRAKGRGVVDWRIETFGVVIQVFNHAWEWSPSAVSVFTLSTPTRRAHELTLQTIFAKPCSASAGRYVGEDVNDGHGVTARVEEAAVPIVVYVPTRSLLRAKLVLEEFRLVLGPKVDDERVAVVPLPNGVDAVEPPRDLGDLVPRVGAELFRGNLAMAREVQVLGVPGRLVMFVVAYPNEQVLHPAVNVVLFDSVGNEKPSLGEKVVDIRGGEVFVALVGFGAAAEGSGAVFDRLHRCSWAARQSVRRHSLRDRCRRHDSAGPLTTDRRTRAVLLLVMCCGASLYRHWYDRTWPTH
jgi:hypothetical protein